MCRWRAHNDRSDALSPARTTMNKDMWVVVGHFSKYIVYYIKTIYSGGLWRIALFKHNILFTCIRLERVVCVVRMPVLVRNVMATFRRMCRLGTYRGKHSTTISWKLNLTKWRIKATVPKHISIALLNQLFRVTATLGKNEHCLYDDNYLYKCRKFPANRWCKFVYLG